jgi:N-acylneuraminate cytidylyltransferase
VDDIKKGLVLLESGSWQYVFSATQFGFPIFRGFERQLDMGLRMFFPEHFKTRSQDLPEAMHDAGQFYWGRTQAWLDELRVFEQWSTVVELPRWRVQDIDNFEDWQRAEIVYRLLEQ